MYPEQVEVPIIHSAYGCITIMANSRKEYKRNNTIIKKFKFAHVNNNVRKGWE